MCAQVVHKRRTLRTRHTLARLTLQLGYAAKAEDVPTVGTAVAGSAAAKEVNITSANLNFTPVYSGYVQRLQSGSFGGKFEVGTLANKEIGIDPVNASAGAKVPGDLQKKVDDLSADLASGKLKLPNFFE